jgi:transposase
MKAFSQDIRERIIQAIQQNEETQDEIARHYKVSLSFLEKLWRRWRDSASCAAKPHAGGAVRHLQEHAVTLRAAITKQPDATLPELGACVVAANGPAVSTATLCRELQRLDLPLKKSRCTRTSGRPRASKNYAQIFGHSLPHSKPSASNLWTKVA